MNRAVYFILAGVLAAGAFAAGSWQGRRGTGKPAAPEARRILHYVDPMNPAHTSDQPGLAPCGMKMEPVYADAAPAESPASAPPLVPGSVKISPDKQQLIGVHVEPVERASGTRALRVLGRVAPDESKHYRLAAAVDGWMVEVSPITTGSQLKKGQWLATFSAPDLFQSCQAYIVALNAMDQLKKSGLPTPLQLNPNNSNFHQRVERLQSLGMSDAQIEEIAQTREIPTGIKVFAPADGFVLARNVLPGQKFERGAEWYRLADLSRVWILADVSGREARWVAPATLARVSIPEQGLVCQARVSEGLPQFDPATRTLKVRLEADNPGFGLRPDLFVDVDVPLTLPSTLAVPTDAVVDSGIKQLVFVARGEGLFEPRAVQTGWRLGDQVEIVEGLTNGERIVVSGTFLLDSESRIKIAAAGKTGSKAKDPVCAMNVDSGDAAGGCREYRGTTYYFCSVVCREKFSQQPELYLTRKTPAAGSRPAGDPAVSSATPGYHAANRRYGQDLQASGGL
ncbi:MAG TPA: efflux RND transporter periplasmic adaptor subunit [Verrucomicrobiae bacterium]